MVNRCNGDKRGQLLLLSAVAILIVVIVGATIINTASFSQYEHAGGIEDDTEEVKDKLMSVEASVEGSIRHMNHDFDRSSGFESIVESDLEGIETSLQEDFVHDGSDVSLNLDGVSEGVRIWRPAHGNLSKVDNGDVEHDYEVVSNTDEVRAFSMSVIDVDRNTDFVVRFNDPDIDDVTFNVSSDGETNINGVCEFGDPDSIGEDDPLRISFVDGTINGVTCDPLPATNDIDTIEFENADTIEAGMNLVVENENANTDLEVNDRPTESVTHVEAHEAIYSAEIDVQLSTPSADFENRVTIAPQRHRVTGGE